jgi:catechol 2,3-dioxygenase-like lactoylglutathione lyase family enzyme
LDAHGSIITLGVHDLEKALAFYRDGLGLGVVDRRENLVVLNFGGILFGLHAVTKSEPGPVTKITLSRNVPDNEAVRRLSQAAARAGGRVVTGPHQAIWGGYSTCFADPDGHLWEVACPANLEPPAEST